MPATTINRNGEMRERAFSASRTATIASPTSQSPCNCLSASRTSATPTPMTIPLVTSRGTASAARRASPEWLASSQKAPVISALRATDPGVTTTCWLACAAAAAPIAFIGCTGIGRR